MNVNALDRIYRLYRFQVLPIGGTDVRIYHYTTKYFSNSDIVILNKEITTERLNEIKKAISDLGYSIQIRNYSSLEEVENSLFDGFFDIEASNKLHLISYDAYKKKIEEITFGDYEYVNSSFVDEEANRIRQDSIINQITKDLSQSGPVLILLEAPAGFGKTSTSYEVLKQLAERENSKQIPLFIELSRNRQASIFKYVLYDEINRQFAGPSLELVNKHIVDGRIPVIIDGFDELLKAKIGKDNIEDKFEDAEPMLETIKEILTGHTKIILTSRRTAMFSDHEFLGWLEKNSTDFSFMHYSISEPAISDWIPAYREKELARAGLNLKSIANPVMLSYLRSMDDGQFSACLTNIDQIINDYLDKLMDREMDRQELKMTVKEQKEILKKISRYFTAYDITSDSRELLETKLIEENSSLLLSVLERYPSGSKPTLDQLVNKLTIHAFLDKKGDSGQQIGFVNEFILGSFIGENILEEGEAWLGSERFLDFALASYIPRATETKKNLYDILNAVIIDMLSPGKRIYIDNYLYGCINHDLESSYITDIEFRNKFTNNVIKNVFFGNCEFYNIDFDFKGISKTSFINCSFYDCKLSLSEATSQEVYFTNCTSNNDVNFSLPTNEDQNNLPYSDATGYERKVLEKFWPTGKERFTPHKRPGTLRLGVPAEDISDVDIAIDALIKKGILIERKGHHSLELNIEHIIEIKKILGR